MIFQLIYGNYIICFGFNIDHYIKLSAQLWGPISWWGQWSFPWFSGWVGAISNSAGLSCLKSCLSTKFGRLGRLDLQGYLDSFRGRPHIWFGWLKELLAGQATCKYPCPFQKYHKYEQTLLPSVQAPTLTPESSYITILFIYVHYCWDIAEIISTIVVLFQMGRRVENTHSETREVP